MVGYISCFKKLIPDVNPKIIFVLNKNHSFNPNGVQWNSDGTISLQEIYTCFSISTHRCGILKQYGPIYVKRSCDTG